jgi:tetratricopeptide (TPR) repeat protein
MKDISQKFPKIMENEDPNESIKQFLALEKDNPFNIEIKQLLSICYRKLGDNTNALKQLTEALELQPLSHSTNFNLGQLHKSFKKYDEALIYFKNSVIFNPEFEKGINTLGDIFFNKKDFREAISYYKRSVDLNKNKDNVFSIFRLGLCFFEKANVSNNNEEKKNAIKYFEMAYELNSEEPSIQRNLIGIYNIYGLKNKAVHLSTKVDGVFEVNTLKNEVKINC